MGSRFSFDLMDFDLVLCVWTLCMYRKLVLFIVFDRQHIGPCIVDPAFYLDSNLNGPLARPVSPKACCQII